MGVFDDIESWVNLKMKFLRKGNEITDNSPDASTNLAELIVTEEDLFIVKKALHIYRKLGDKSPDSVKLIVKAFSRKADLPRILGLVALSYPAALNARANYIRSHFWIIFGPSGCGKTMSSEKLGETLLNLHATAHKLLSESGHKREETYKIIAAAAKRDLSIYEPYIGKIDWDKYAKDFVDAVANYGTSERAAKVKSFVEALYVGEDIVNNVDPERAYYVKKENGAVSIESVFDELPPIIKLDEQLLKSFRKRENGSGLTLFTELILLAGDRRNHVAMYLDTEIMEPPVIAEILWLRETPTLADRLGLLMRVHGQTARFKDDSKIRGMYLAEQMRKNDLWNLFTRGIMGNDPEANAYIQKQLEAAGWSGDKIDRFKKDMKSRFLGIAQELQDSLRKAGHEDAADLFDGAGLAEYIHDSTNQIYSDAIINPAKLINGIEGGLHDMAEKTDQFSPEKYDHVAVTDIAYINDIAPIDNADEITNELKEVINDFSKQLGFDSSISSEKDLANGLSGKGKSSARLKRSRALAEVFEEEGDSDYASEILQKSEESAKKKLALDELDPNKVLQEVEKYNQASEEKRLKKLRKEMDASGMFDKLSKSAKEYVENVKKSASREEGAGAGDIFRDLENEFDVGDANDPAADAVFDETKRLSNSEFCKIISEDEFERAKVKNRTLISAVESGDKIIAADLSIFISGKRKFEQLRELKDALTEYLGEEEANKHIRNLISDIHGPSLVANLYMTALGVYD